MNRCTLNPAAFVLLTVVAACDAQEPGSGSSIEITLQYDDEIGLDTADVSIANHVESAEISRRLFVLIPDQVIGRNLSLEVWGSKSGQRIAYGTTSVVPVLDETIPLSLTLTPCGSNCDEVDPLDVTPSTEVDPGDTDEDTAEDDPADETSDDPADEPTGETTTDTGDTAAQIATSISTDALINTDTGEITGGLARRSGVGTYSNIGYLQQEAASGGAPLAVFTFKGLAIERSATVTFTGKRAVVLQVGDSGRIDGYINVAAGRNGRWLAGPGGGAGGTSSVRAEGCGAGGNGARGTNYQDAGGGGAGASTAGAIGGGTPTIAGGAQGPACIAANLRPLRGGSGGGRGSPGRAVTTARGGGGGGAIQITALRTLDITGRINANGAGGEGGGAVYFPEMDVGSGGGGGSGGAILLEAPSVVIRSTAVLVANGGGGGASAMMSSSGPPGSHGQLSSTPASGGLALFPDQNGGSGGAAAVTPNQLPARSAQDGGGGGGAAGVIVVRGQALVIDGIISPPATALAQ